MMLHPALHRQRPTSKPVAEGCLALNHPKIYGPRCNSKRRTGTSLGALGCLECRCIGILMASGPCLTLIACACGLLSQVYR